MPDKQRRRKNNKNKRKNNRNNKSEQSPNKVSANDIENIVECVNDEVRQSNVTQNLENSLEKISCEVKAFSTTSNSNETEPENKIPENESQKTAGPSNESPCSPVDSSVKKIEDEVDCTCYDENEKNTDDLSLNNIPNLSEVCDTQIGNTITIEQKQSDIDIVNKRDESHVEYLVESPDQKTVHNPKLSNNVKSKSVDNDDSPTITEVTEEISQNNENDASLSIIDCKNAIITDADSDIEWQKTDDLKDSSVSYTSDVKILPVTSIPLNTAQCDKANILKSEDEISLRNFLQTLNLSANPEDSNTLEIRAEIEHIINREIKHRLRKRGLAEDFVFQRGPSRSLTVIDEEGSSESSATSRRQSYLSEKASDTDELEDDVFENKIKACKDQIKGQIRPAHRVYPTFQTIPQECIRVDAKIKEPEITEARGSWAMKQTETLTGAELVYLTDSSSSTSSVYDLNDDKETAEDNDVSVRIITPTIEVTDTEKLLTNSCLMKQETDKKDHKIENKKDIKVPNSNGGTSTQNRKHNDSHEIVIESIDNIETNLFVKEIADDSSSILGNKINDNDLIKTIESYPKIANKYDLEMKVIKCELNDAINNLIKEVTSDSECVQSENLLQRQDSSSSLGSSQCTAKYNPNHSSLNDVADIITESHIEPHTQLTHVKEVYAQAVTDKNYLNSKTNSKVVTQPYTLKEVCLQKITSLPYGNKILEELANVSECLQNMSLQNATLSTESKKILESHSDAKNNIPERNSIPPPIQPRTSSFKITKDEYKQEFLSTPGRNIRCVSPSNKMLMEKTNTVIKDDKPRFSLPIQNNLKHIDDHFIRRDNNKNYQMKSETGSRLLSLLRDTSVKSNSSPFLYKSNTNENLEKLSKIGFSENFRQYAKSNKCAVSQFESHEKYKSDTFRPLPSPKLRSFSSSFYESDDSSDITENTLRKMHNEKRYFHYSTGNLNKDIENDVSSIQNMHRHYMNVRDKSQESRPRRPSLPKDLCDQQMEYIRQKEKEVDAELERLQRESTSLKNKRNPRAPMISEESFERRTLSSSYKKPLIKEVHSTKTEKRQMSSIFSSSEEELRREKMYSEYISQMAEREKRRDHKVIKITKPSPVESEKISKSTTALDSVDRKVNNPIEGEFISKARERWNKLGIMDPETEDEKEQSDVYREPKVIEHKIKVIDAGEEKDVKRLPSHLQEFVSFTVKDTDRRNSPETVMITPTFKARSSSPVVWRPGAPAAPVRSESSSTAGAPLPPPPPVWSPSSAPSPQSQRKTFRPVHFEESPPPRRKASAENGCLSGSDSEGRLKTSHSAPVTGLNTLGLSANSRLPRAQNPTVTLLQKAREGLLQQTNIIQQERDARLPRDRPSPPRGDPVYALRAEYDASEGDGRRSKMSDGHKKVDGIGPTTKDGMPVTLRSEVKDPSRWYKKMYDTIHKNKYDDDYVTIRYKNCRGETIQRPSSNRSQYAYFDPRSGYLSEPEGRRVPSAWSDYDSDATGPRRRTASVQEERRNESPYMTNKYSTLASARASQEVYKGQPGRIENYVPGRSSVIDKEAKQWWDEVMDIFDGQQNMSNSSLPQASPKEKKDITSAILSKSNMARALKESGYESDSTLIFRRREETDGPLSPAERRAAYRDLQAGGEPPLRGFRSPAPPRQDDSEIEYIPISKTLTKIRVHKVPPHVREVICYPVTKIENDRVHEGRKFCAEDSLQDPPAPPRRVSSKNSRTLQLVTSTKPNTKALQTQEQSNVDFLKNKISNKLNRQNTHTILKKGPSTISNAPVNSRIMSTSAPPAINRSKYAENLHSPQRRNPKQFGTSSFSSPRRTLTPNNYATANLDRFGEQQKSIKIEGGVGRKTPISNILDKATAIDKLWSSQKRNERIDFTKIKPKNTLKTGTQIIKPLLSSQIRASNITRQCSPPVTHKSRDMLRTSEKIQRMKHLNQHTKSVPCLFKKDSKFSKETSSVTLPTSKSISNLVPVHLTRNQNSRQIKSAVITNLKKKKISSSNAIVAKPLQTSHADKKDEVKTKVLKEKLKQNHDGNTRGLLKVSSNGITKYSKCSKLPKADSNYSNNIYGKKRPFEEDLSNSYDSFDSNTFFQHLFLRNVEPLSMKELSDQSCAGLVFEKAKLFQSLPDKISNYSYSNPLNTYLINRKPVSLSRFVKWDRNPSPISYKKPRSISWPGKMDGKIRKFESLHVPRSEMGSTSSLTSIRSKSEPPVRKLYFSQTSRPVSPTVIFHKKTVQRLSSPPKSSILKSNIKSSNKVYSRGNNFTLPANKFPSVKIVPSVKTPQNKDECKMIQLRVPLSSRSVSPQESRSICFSRSHSTSPVSIRSPSYRKIHLTRTQNKFDKVNKKENRSCSAESKSNQFYDEDITRVNSEPNLYRDDPEYDEYIRDIQSTKSRSERFRELNRYYAYLERVAELEKTTCYNNDLLIRKKDEEVIDFDRWKKIRAIERAEEELNNLYEKLRQAQRDNDVLFYPRDVKDFRWKFDSERGLKIKEKSVEDLKDELQQKSTNDYNDSLVLQKPSDTYKPLWRGKSVAETAFDINNKRENKKEKGQPIRTHLVLQDDSFQELRKKIGIGNRLWSSLSIDQVTALKDQLNAIYSKELESKSLAKTETQKYEIEVNNLTKKKNPNLYVRCSSLGTPRETPSLQDNKTLVKSQSIASIDSPKPTEKEMKNNANRMQMSLTECEKKLISQNISKEVLNKLNKLDHMPLISFDNNCQSSTCNNNNKLLEDQNNKQKECKARHVIYPNVNSAPSNQSSASETDTGSSDVSGRTVIYRDNKIGVKKKVEYFESVKSVQNQPKTIFHARENSDEQKEKSPSIQLTGETIRKPVTNNLICQSQSCTNFKELFGESNTNNFLSLPLKTAVRSRSPSPYSGVHERDRNTPDTLPYSSNETISRSRSPSPDPERVWRTYLKFSRGGEVRRLVRRFDSPSSVGAILRRHRSDPEIARNVYKNNWSTIEGEPSQRQKWKTLTVARVPLRPTNRFMPHIDIISKLAALRKRPTTRSRSAEEAIECRPGEVERIRRKFETMSLLGQIYSSAPDIRELNEFPFLAGPWIAHQYPKPSDNNRSVTSPDKFVRGRTSPIKKDVKVATTKKPLKLNTILKHEPLSKQAFNPEAHRPASRYEPPRTPPRPPPAAWPYHLAPFVMPTRNTVQFQEGESAPEPPRRSAYGSYSDTESPNRRYVESDVNIHYRCPVRRDPLPLVPERELARQQAEHMKSLYREQKRNKYLQDNNIDPLDIQAFDASMKELQDAQNRRHQDNFMPSQKLVIPPNRYDEAEKIVARALYTFNGQTSRELSFRKGDFISVRRQIDANWYEGEIHGRIGLFPYNYVELIKGDGSRSPRRSAVIEGRAKAKFDFTAQTNLELPLKKGEIVTLTRRIDQNWWEGRNGHKTGIFPDSYVTVLQEPSQSKPESQPILNTDKPVASPAAHGLLNGSDKRSMGTHSYTPQQNSSALANAPPATQPLPGYAVSKNQRTVTPSDRGYGPPTGAGVDLNNTEPLYVDTNAEAIPYRAMYKYRPQNPDELELSEGDTVYVLEKCDDGWYVGSSQRTGRFGTFPGNYVERI